MLPFQTNLIQLSISAGVPLNLDRAGRKGRAMSIDTESALRIDRLRMDNSQRQIRVLVADDHALIREIITKFLEILGNFKVYSVTDLPSLINICRQVQFDIVLLDLGMPGMQGLSSIKIAVSTAQSSKVIIFSGSVSQDLLQGAVRIGVRGFIPKTMGIRSIACALRLIDEGEIFIPSQIALGLILEPKANSENEEGPILTEQERLVLKKISLGRRNTDIQLELHLRPSTVRTLIRSAARKLKCRNRAHAVLAAQRLNLI